jgi:alkyl hydroperoxide reductase subunit F
MIDGEFAPELVTELGIQGVPSVVDGNKLIHSGKITLLGLVEKLEKAYGKNENIKNKKDLGLYDIVVIGGGPAGVSSAIYTSRKGLKTALITDRIGGQVQDTKSIENMISINYTEGKDLSNSLDKHMKDYDINILEHRKVESIENGNTKRLNLNSGETISCKSLVIATGAEWKELGIEGEKEYNGRGVAFCPHCDGPYYKGKDISVIGGGNSGVEAAIDLAGIVNSVTLFEFAPELNADNILITKLKSLENVSVVTNAKTTRIIGNGEKVTSMEYEDRSQNKIKSIKLDGIFVQIGLVPNSGFIKGLVDTNKYGEILVSEKNRTNIDKIYAAGDVTNVPYKQIIIAMGEGAKVGLTAFEDLMIA